MSENLRSWKAPLLKMHLKFMIFFKILFEYWLSREIILSFVLLLCIKKNC
ncbi:unnamed protein product [Meloidogyne enterolobii]|uniref:Uncharacterized protein n=1 Tax=Meloidogyne enterolobii TaxID=390850 RepID=A0ACB1A4I3_MELEN